MDEEHLKRFSTNLSQVMTVIGLNECMVSLRRHYSGLIDIYRTIYDSTNVCGNKQRIKFSTFGSQSEGSTTPGMSSDYDILLYFEGEVACIGFNKKNYQNIKDLFLVVQEPMCLPQCCCVYACGKVNNGVFFISYDHISISKISQYKTGQFVLDDKSRPWTSPTYRLNNALDAYNNELIRVRQHGPAVTEDNIDWVFAIRCMTLPNKCRVLFTRPRPGHWPTQETLFKAEQCEMYLVHPGVLSHTFGYDNRSRFGFIKVKYQSKYVDSQFRMSTNMTERLLMFDLNIVQMKAYVVTKMIRKEFLQPLVDDRLSTFHMKTALLFTVERFPEGIWRDDNLVQCVLYCLTTLKRFLKKRYCPHYTIDSVNLFAEKLQVNEFNIVKDKVTKMINSGLSCLRNLKMDNVGEMLSTGYGQFKTPVPVLYFNTIKQMITELHHFHMNADVDEQKSLALAIQSALLNEQVYRAELTFILNSLYSTIASHEASDCIGKGTEVTSDIIKRYETSLSSHTLTSHLRYASMLVSTKQYKRAIGVLDKMETAVAKYYLRRVVFDIFETEWYKFEQSYDLITLADTILIPLCFVNGEIMCVPSHLIYEKFRAITEDEIKGSNIEIVFASDLEPLFYYLQYLSSRGNESSKRKAFDKLFEYCESESKHQFNDCLYSALNMLGHALELENKVPEAWKIYRKSVTIQPSYNAAYWHLFRIFGQCVFCTFI